MNPETIFQVCNSIALLGWIVLLFISPFWWKFDKINTGIIITLLCIVYTWLIVTNFNPGDFESFNSLDGVVNLFQDKNVVTGGWVHYLAFDLFIGTWIKKDAVKNNIPHLVIVPALLCCFMLGPIGLLLYLLIRWFKTKNYWIASFD